MDRLQVQHRIVKLMSLWAVEISSMGRLSLTDLNNISETILVPLLSEIFDWPDLQNLNTESKNFPGIDLADDKKRVAIQVTSTNTSKKIKHTLTEFVDEDLRLYEKYDRLIVISWLRSKKHTAVQVSTIFLKTVYEKDST
jgi:hypothetical protein